MVDTLQVLRDPQASRDDTWDEATGRYVEHPFDLDSSDFDTIYVGPGLISSHGWEPTEQLVAGTMMVISRFKASIPIETPTVNERDFIVVLESMRSEQLVGAVFIVRDRVDSSFAISQSLLVERRTLVPPR